MENQNNLGPILVGYAELSQLGIKFSVEHIRILERDGHFPTRIRLSPKRVAWRMSDIEAWIDSRPTGRDTLGGH
jgi:predicted DNA-binding transcriptional regulator AlpA